MLQRHLDLLTCPDCGPAFPLRPAEEGEGITCPQCGRIFVEKGGVLDLAPAHIPSQTVTSVDHFGASWSSHEYLAPYQEQQFLDWLAPLKENDFKGKTALEAGCGKGRHTFLMAGYGTRNLFSVDLSDAVAIAARYTRAFPSVHCVRGDLMKIPLSTASMDIVVCLGVLHHLKDPETGLRELWRVLKPGGTLCLWVYAREGNGWIVHFVDPIRKGITSRLPTKILRPLLLPLTLTLYILLKVFYGPATKKGKNPAGWLPYSSYLGYISKFPFREIEHIVLDHLCPPIAFYLSRDSLEKWFTALKPESIEFRWHNRNSWNIVAKRKEF